MVRNMEWIIEQERVNQEISLNAKLDKAKRETKQDLISIQLSIIGNQITLLAIGAACLK